MAVFTSSVVQMSRIVLFCSSICSTINKIFLIFLEAIAVFVFGVTGKNCRDAFPRIALLDKIAVFVYWDADILAIEDAHVCVNSFVSDFECAASVSAIMPDSTQKPS